MSRIAVRFCAMKRPYEQSAGQSTAAHHADRRGHRGLAYVGRPGRDFDQGHRRAAGVERHTVYAHFPDERSLFRRLLGTLVRAPPVPGHMALVAEHPDPDDGCAEHSTAVRLVRGERGRARAGATDAAVHHSRPNTWDIRSHLARLAHDLAGAFGRRRRVRAAVGHALAFETWKSLARQGLTRRGAVDLMVRLVRATW